LNELQKHIHSNLKQQSLFTTKELIALLVELNPSSAYKTHAWKINQLVKEQFIHKIGRGLYSFEFKPEYVPELSLKTKRLYNRIKSYCHTDLVVWDTSLLNNIADINIDRHWMFFQTSKKELEPLFNNILDFSKQCFLQPDKEIINRYLIPQSEAIILTPLISETPVYKNGDYITLSIEGILLNAWLRNENYLKPIGFNIQEIYSKAFLKYNINQSKLLRFAARRDKRTEIEELIKTIR
jgi:hypothetical protein